MKTTFAPSNPKRTIVARSARVSSCLVIALCFGLVGCAQKAKEESAVNPAGIYQLVSVDGKAVPCAVSHQNHEMQVKSGVFTINPDGTCSSKVTFAVAGHDEMVREVKATYAQEGAKLTMQWEGAGTTTGEVADGTFTMNNEGMIFAYRK